MPRKTKGTFIPNYKEGDILVTKISNQKTDKTHIFFKTVDRCIFGNQVFLKVIRLEYKKNSGMTLKPMLENNKEINEDPFNLSTIYSLVKPNVDGEIRRRRKCEKLIWDSANNQFCPLKEYKEMGKKDLKIKTTVYQPTKSYLNQFIQ